jgi:sulfoxide reductase heme-binding subunit YedZ
MPSNRQIRFFLKPLVFLACTAPLAWIGLRVIGFGPSLGPNPVEVLQDEFGIWTLRLLLATLAMTPMRYALGKAWPIRFRRMLGLFAFSYATLHFANYLVLDQQFDWALILEDILDRPFITVGFVGLMLLVPLAITSTRGWQSRLGKRWIRLHKLVYPATILVCWHFWWQVKKDATEPLIYVGLLILLLGARLWHNRRGARVKTTGPTTS